MFPSLCELATRIALRPNVVGVYTAVEGTQLLCDLLIVTTPAPKKKHSVRFLEAHSPSALNMFFHALFLKKARLVCTAPELS